MSKKLLAEVRAEVETMEAAAPALDQGRVSLSLQSPRNAALDNFTRLCEVVTEQVEKARRTIAHGPCVEARIELDKLKRRLSDLKNKVEVLPKLLGAQKPVGVKTRLLPATTILRMSNVSCTYPGKEVCDSVATEKLIMKQGRAHVNAKKGLGPPGGGVFGEKSGDGERSVAVRPTANVTTTEKDMRKSIEEIENKIQDGNKKPLTDEEMWELEDKLKELKESLKGTD